MATPLACRRKLFQFFSSKFYKKDCNFRGISTWTLHVVRRPTWPVVTVCAGCAVAWYFQRQYGKIYSTVSAKQQEGVEVAKSVGGEAGTIAQSEDGSASHMQSGRERRFRMFASVQCDGHIYMTPQDFLDSVTEEDPRPRLHRVVLSRDQLDAIVAKTVDKKYGSTHFFRNIYNQGIISYTEYLFLLCVLTKPRSGFEIAFNMFDTDGNQKVDKDEFLVIRDCLSGLKVSREFPKLRYSARGGPGPAYRGLYSAADDNLFSANDNFNVDNNSPRFDSRLSLSALVNTFSVCLERVFKSVNDGDRPPSRAKEETLCVAEEAEPMDTTLLVHLFGKKGRQVLRYKDFYTFMEDLQTEVLELEFNEFSKGMKTISEEDFARILLRYTHIHSQDQQEYVDRLKERMPEEKGIVFEEFRQFCQFLNNLDDFSIAMRIYTLSDHPVTQSEFQRAVKISTGCKLTDHLVNTVFQIFDKDGDGSLSYKEFIAVMKDRLHRGFRSHLVRPEGWKAFKACVKQQLRNT